MVGCNYDDLMWQDLRRLVAYATSSAKFLSNIIMKNQVDSYGWEVSAQPFTFPYNFDFLV